jgi:hypothetical protein
MTTPLNTWISVKDAMPENISDDIELVVIDIDAYLWYAEYYKDRFFRLTNESELFSITHWMLISKPESKKPKMTKEEIEKITRLEIIDYFSGRKLVEYLKSGDELEFSFQDEGRTLKIFIKKPDTKP